MARSKLTYQQSRLIESTLAELIIVTPGEEFCRYKDDWTDVAVARSLPFTATDNNVAHIRNTMFGQLRAAPHVKRGALEMASVERRFELIEEALVETNERLGDVGRALAGIDSKLQALAEKLKDL